MTENATVDYERRLKNLSHSSSEIEDGVVLEPEGGASAGSHDGSPKPQFQREISIEILKGNFCWYLT